VTNVLVKQPFGCLERNSKTGRKDVYHEVNLYVTDVVLTQRSNIGSYEGPRAFDKDSVYQ
jgi:hypothetical protein